MAANKSMNNTAAPLLATRKTLLNIIERSARGILTSSQTALDGN